MSYHVSKSSWILVDFEIKVQYKVLCEQISLLSHEIPTFSTFHSTFPSLLSVMCYKYVSSLYLHIPDV